MFTYSKTENALLNCFRPGLSWSHTRLSSWQVKIKQIKLGYGRECLDSIANSPTSLSGWELRGLDNKNNNVSSATPFESTSTILHPSIAFFKVWVNNMDEKIINIYFIIWSLDCLICLEVELEVSINNFLLVFSCRWLKPLEFWKL